MCIRWSHRFWSIVCLQYGSIGVALAVVLVLVLVVMMVLVLVSIAVTVAVIASASRVEEVSLRLCWTRVAIIASVDTAPPVICEHDSGGGGREQRKANLDPTTTRHAAHLPFISGFTGN